MVNKEKLQAAVDELLAVCNKHGVVIVGTCRSEGIYGEITLFDNAGVKAADIQWNAVADQLKNSVVALDDGDFVVEGIGRFLT